MREFKVGDIVRIDGYQPMSSMSEYEQKTGVIISLEKRAIGEVARVKLDADGSSINTGTKFLKLISTPYGAQ